MSLKANKKSTINVRYIAATGILGALATVLMMVSFSVPFMPSFLKLDLSDLPALIASFSMGPVSGVMVCLVKNLINIVIEGTTTFYIGELANFIYGVCLVLPAGIIYKYRKTRRAALISALLGAVMVAVVCVPINYYLVYPIYCKFMPLEAILGMYRAILPVEGWGLIQYLLVFNVPFSLLKGVLVTLITFVLYKRISPIIKGRN